MFIRLSEIPFKNKHMICSFYNSHMYIPELLLEIMVAWEQPGIIDPYLINDQVFSTFCESGAILGTGNTEKKWKGH